MGERLTHKPEIKWNIYTHKRLLKFLNIPNYKVHNVTFNRQYLLFCFLSMQIKCRHQFISNLYPEVEIEMETDDSRFKANRSDSGVFSIKFTSLTSSKTPLQWKEIACSTERNNLISSLWFVSPLSGYRECVNSKDGCCRKTKNEWERSRGTLRASFTQQTILLDIKQRLWIKANKLLLFKVQ